MISNTCGFFKNILGWQVDRNHNQQTPASTIQKIGTVAGGTILGYLGGVIANFIKTNSLFDSIPLDCVDFESVDLQILNSFKEAQLESVRRLRIPHYETIAFSSLSFINSCFQSATESKFSLGFIKNAAQKIGERALFPAYSYFSSLIVSAIFREYALDPILSRFNIDASGHAIIQMLHVNFRYLALQEFSKMKSPLTSEFMSTMNKIQLLSEFVWSFHTAADCHSVVDIASGIAVGLSAAILTNQVIIPEIKKMRHQIFF